MATLTAAQLEAIRRKVGIEDCTPASYSDDDIQAVYDSVDSDLNLTYVELLEQMWGSAKAAVVNLAQGGTAVSVAKAKAIKERLDYYAVRAGVAGGGLFVGVLGLSLDEPCPDGDTDCLEART